MKFDAERELDALYDDAKPAYGAAVESLLVACAMGDSEAVAAAEDALEDVLGSAMGAAECLGALDALHHAGVALDEEAPERVNEEEDRRRLSVVFTRTKTGWGLPRIRFKEMLDDLIQRAPVTIRDVAERTARRIAEMYSKGRVIAFVKATTRAVTERVHKLLIESVERGLVEREAGTLITLGAKAVKGATADWTEAYSRTVFRTNVNTATSAGRFRQVRDPVVAGVIPAMIFSAIHDDDVRPNHLAADGLILRQDNLLWDRIAPPLGYNCRCTIQFVSRPTLRRMGRLNADGSIREDSIPAGAYPDPGFRHTGRAVRA